MPTETNKTGSPAATIPATSVTPRTTSPASTSDTDVVPNVSAPMAEEANITLSKEAFDALMSRLGNLEETQKLHMQVEDRNKIQRIEELRRSGKIIKSVKVRKLEGKYVLGFHTLQDEVYMVDGRLYEKQRIEVVFEGGEKKEVGMREWASAAQYVPFDVVKESRDEDGELFFTVRDSEGKTLEINARHIN